jgi:membrane protease YdiL (CAAX protease family)
MLAGVFGSAPAAATSLAENGKTRTTVQGTATMTVADMRPSVFLTRRSAIAPTWHTILLLLFVLAPLLQSLAAGPAARPLAPIPFYLTSSVVLSLWFAFAWWGLRLRNTTLQEVIGRHRATVAAFSRDVLVAASFWVFWYAILSALKPALILAGVSNSGSPGMVYPHKSLEVAVWIVNAVIAGFVEEFVFRGYLMRQFTAWTGSSGIGLVLQACVFGTCHGYLLGLRQMVIITVSGALIGIVALWCKSLRPGMIFHAWADIFGAAIVRGLPFR